MQWGVGGGSRRGQCPGGGLQLLFCGRAREADLEGLDLGKHVKLDAYFFIHLTSQANLTSRGRAPETELFFLLDAKLTCGYLLILILFLTVHSCI